MKKIVLLLLISIFSFAQMQFTKPALTFDNPRKWLIKLHTADIHVVNHTLGAIYNVLSEYPPEAINIAVIVYGKGMRVLKKDYDKKTLSRISSLMDYDVEFVGCKNTMKTMKWTEDDFIDGINYVQAGVAEVIERQYDGWYVNTPY
jgi:intracellular sulfur oxidation DsrE/DsrF family protein